MSGDEVLTYISPYPPGAVITLGRSRIHPRPDGLFVRDPADAALPAVTLVVGNELGDYLDTVAWDPCNPGRWWLEFGQADVLGLPAIFLCRI